MCIFFVFTNFPVLYIIYVEKRIQQIHDKIIPKCDQLNVSESVLIKELSDMVLYDQMNIRLKMLSLFVFSWRLLGYEDTNTLGILPWTTSK